MPRPTPTPRRSVRPRVEALEDRLAPAVVPTGFTDTVVVSGLTRPTAMTIAPDGRIFVAEQRGDLRIVKDGTLLPTPSLSIDIDSVGERGLLSVALDPDFSTNNYVYVYYTVAGSPAHNRVSRFTANGDVIAPNSEFALIDLDPLDETSHNGGAIHFGPDGKLYIATGDNVVSLYSQSLTNTFGKILRINKDGSIPADNPFFSETTGINRAIWALGLRNPFTFSFQRTTGRMFINDVGGNFFEEINDGVAGGNYGWPFHEGPENPTDPNYIDPFFAYARPSTGAAITGGAFYNPVTVTFPAEYLGDYFFADLVGRWIRRIDTATRTVSEFATGILSPVDLDVAPDGSLYYLAYGRGLAGGGHIGRIQYVASNGTLPGSHSVGVYDPATATWYQRHTNSPGAPDTAPFVFGQPGTIPIVGDWDGNGRQTVGSFAPGSAQWELRNSNAPGDADAGSFAFGVAGWIPVVGDWNGDGKQTIGVFDPSTATWYLRNFNAAGAPDVTPFAFGVAGWIPIVGDWNGDGIDSVGVFDPNTATFYLRNFNSAGAPSIEPFAFGVGGWRPVVGNWNADARDTVGVYDPATATWYLRNVNSAGAPDIEPFAYGVPGWLPVPGRWQPALALRAAAGPGPGAAPLTAAELDGLAAALAVRGVTFEIRDLGGDLLGLAFAGPRRVVLDDDAAGHGWFVDPTPHDDVEFGPGGAAAGRIDLLTVLRHELGHLDGLPDLDPAADALMAGALPTGVRR